MLIDIVILPPKDLRKKIRRKNIKEIGHFPSFFVVDNTNLIPHLSLWHMKIAKSSVGRIAKELKKVTKGPKPVKINSSGFHALEKYKGCVEFGVKNNKALVLLQSKVFQSVWIFKSGKMPQFASFLKIKYSKVQLEEIKKYGRSIEFTPHFTMGWLKHRKYIKTVVKNMRGMKFSFPAKEVYICEIDKWWQVKRILKRINFSL